MSKHSIVRAGVGLGLMAASLGAMAQLHTFAEPLIYYKVNGSAVNYVAFLPNSADSAIVMLDLFQSGSISTWAFGVGGSVDAAAGGALWGFNASKSTQSDSGQAFSYTYYDVLGRPSGATWGTSSSGISQTANSTWYGGDTAAISLQFQQALTVSSQACNVTFGVSLGTDDYMRYGNFTISAGGFPTASNSVSYRTASGTVAASTSSIASAVWNAQNFSATSAFPTFAAFSVPNADGAGNTVAVSALTRGNLCTSIYTAKAALNSAGNVIGATTGLMRLW